MALSRLMLHSMQLKKHADYSNLSGRTGMAFSDELLIANNLIILTFRNNKI